VWNANDTGIDIAGPGKILALHPKSATSSRLMNLIEDKGGYYG
jgi:hypothetical protein